MNDTRIAIDTSDIPSARYTNLHVKSLAVLPTFVHKWSKKRRPYERQELLLPEKLYMRGRWPNWDKLLVGVGGTRSPTAETFDYVADICSILTAKGATINSGGVPGVDLAAHLAAVGTEQGATIAIVANPCSEGLKGHEWSNSLLENAIIKTGALLSEYSTHVDQLSDEFRERLLARDRIITGLSDVFVAFECNDDSATVDAAYRALSQGKKVVAVEPLKRTYRQGVQQLIANCSRNDNFACFHQANTSANQANEIIMNFASRSRALRCA